MDTFEGFKFAPDVWTEKNFAELLDANTGFKHILSGSMFLIHQGYLIIFC